MLTASELRARRAVERLSQKDFAKNKLHISRGYLIDIERERVKPSKKLEARYDELYAGKRLIVISEWKKAFPCPNCESSLTEQLPQPPDLVDKIWRCKKCGYCFPQSYALR